VNTFAPQVAGDNPVKAIAAISNHNDSLPGDTLATFSVNYEWRRLMVHMCEKLLDRRIWQGTEIEIDDAVLKAHRLLLDLYDVEAGMGTNEFLGARVGTTGDITLVAALNPITFNTSPTLCYDSDSMWSAGNPTRLTIPAGTPDAYYHVTFRGRITIGTSSNVNTWLRKNGTDDFAREAQQSSFSIAANVESDIFLSAGDYVEVYMSASPVRTLLATAGLSAILQIHRIGE